jgi:hypothetical protein
VAGVNRGVDVGTVRGRWRGRIRGRQAGSMDDAIRVTGLRKAYRGTASRHGRAGDH